MRILINASSAHVGGSITYLTNLLRFLPGAMPESEFIVYLPEQTCASLQSLHLASTITLIPYPYASTSGIKRLYFDQVFIAQVARQQHCDLLFSSTGFGTLFCPCPQVLLVRNALYFEKNHALNTNDSWQFRLKTFIRRRWSFVSIRAADLILFPTQAMQNLVGANLPLQHIKTEVLHYGFDHDNFLHDQSPSPIVEQLQQWRNEGYSILVNVSLYAIHKNFETVIESLPSLVQKGHRIRFVTTLSREKTDDKEEFDRLTRRIEQLGLTEVVVRLGHIPHAQLTSIYQASDIFIFPSVSESFGHPMVEAMAAGLPIVASDIEVNQEVCGKAGIYFQTLDKKSCASAIEQLLVDKKLRNQLGGAARQQSLLFSWHEYAILLTAHFRKLSQTRTLYQRTASKPISQNRAA